MNEQWGRAATRWLSRVIIYALVALGSAACTRRGLSPGEGFITVPGGRVWYRVVGSGTRTPLLLVHGCCAAASYYLKPLAALADERPVVFYDQLSTGHSDHPSDTTLWRLDRTLAELTRVREALGLREVHLFGHSGGANVAAEYAFTRPPGVRSLILAGGGFAVPRYLHDVDSMRKLLPAGTRETLERHERAGTCEAPEYRAAQAEYDRRFFTLREPRTPDVDSSYASSEATQAMYRRLTGRGCDVAGLPDFPPTYDATDRLRAITLPTLFTAGAHEAPATTRFYQGFVRDARLAILERSAHLTMQDEPVKYVEVLREFLRRVERR